MDSSELAARNIIEQEETSKLEEEEAMTAEWTDEKHGLFLKSMESAFVNQLYRSIEMFGLQSHKSRSKSLKQKQTSTRTSSGQFKVLRDGFWSKVDFEKDETEHQQGKDSEVPLSNPWIQRYRTSKIQGNKRSPGSGSGSGSCAKAKTPTTMPTSSSPPSSADFSDTNIEVTDQNFNDGALEDGKAAKIDDMKATSSSDQIVPNGIGGMTDQEVHCTGAFEL